MHTGSQQFASLLRPCNNNDQNQISFQLNRTHFWPAIEPSYLRHYRWELIPTARVPVTIPGLDTLPNPKEILRVIKMAWLARVTNCGRVNHLGIYSLPVQSSRSTVIPLWVVACGANKYLWTGFYELRVKALCGWFRQWYVSSIAGPIVHFSTSLFTQCVSVSHIHSTDF